MKAENDPREGFGDLFARPRIPLFSFINMGDTWFPRFSGCFKVDPCR